MAFTLHLQQFATTARRSTRDQQAPRLMRSPFKQTPALDPKGLLLFISKQFPTAMFIRLMAVCLHLIIMKGRD
jgi:hypothetical protein